MGEMDCMKCRVHYFKTDLCEESFCEKYWGEGNSEDFINAIKQPDRKKGEWIDYSEDGFVECPFCHSATNCDGNREELHYCFSCGAELR